MNKLSPTRRQQIIYLLADILSAEVVWILFLLFRWLVYEGHVLDVNDVLIPAFSFYPPLLLYPVGCMIVYYLSGFYLHPLSHTHAQTFFSTFASALVIALGAFFIIVIDDIVDSYNRYYVSLIVLFGLQFTCSYIPRLIISTWSHHHFDERVFVLRSDSEKSIEALMNAMPVDRVHIVLSRRTSERRIYSLIGRIYPLKTRISLPATTFDILSGAAKIVDLDGSPMIMITDQKMPDSELAFKRAFDVVTCLIGLVLLSPLFLVIALAVKLSSKGPIIYRQERIGLYGMPFNILKFRTMKDKAEDNVPQLTDINDPRITRIGRFLRKYRLDELPQLWNVVRGDMSIVGPRPEREYFIEQIVQRAPYYCLIYRTRPGLTSWGPIKVGYTDTIDKMVERLNYDVAYIENMSLRLDAKIIFYTFRVILNGEGQ